MAFPAEPADLMNKVHPGHEDRRQRSNQRKRERKRIQKAARYKETRHQFIPDRDVDWCDLCWELEDYEFHELHQEQLI